MNCQSRTVLKTLMWMFALALLVSTSTSSHAADHDVKPGAERQALTWHAVLATFAWTQDDAGDATGEQDDDPSPSDRRSPSPADANADNGNSAGVDGEGQAQDAPPSDDGAGPGCSRSCGGCNTCCEPCCERKSRKRFQLRGRSGRRCR